MVFGEKMTNLTIYLPFVLILGLISWLILYGIFRLSRINRPIEESINDDIIKYNFNRRLRKWWMNERQ